VLKTEANGTNLGLQLADGTLVRFTSTARTATSQYSVAVRQMQATSFVTDNDNHATGIVPLPHEDHHTSVKRSASHAPADRTACHGTAAERALGRRRLG